MMQPLEVGDKPAGQHADLAAGKGDSVIGRKRRTDLLSLPVVQKSLQPDVDHDIVADDAARWDQARQRRAPFLCTAAGNAHAHRLPDPERAMTECHAGTCPCLSDACRSAADGAPLRGLLGVDEHTGDALRALPALLLQLLDRLPQACDLGQRDRAAVFFTP